MEDRRIILKGKDHPLIHKDIIQAYTLIKGSIIKEYANKNNIPIKEIKLEGYNLEQVNNMAKENNDQDKWNEAVERYLINHK